VVNAPAGLRLRAGVGTDTPIIGKVPHRSRVELLCDVVERGGIRWARVQAGRREGWVAAREGQRWYLMQP
jgi:uncharacterized protein YraI